MLKDRILMMLDADDGTGIGGAEEPEVAELAEEEVEGAEDQEVADPEDGDEDSGKTSADSAFAELRRQNEEYQRQLQEYDEALGFFFEGDEKPLQARALAEERSIDEVRADKEAEDELEQLRQQIETLQEERANAEAEQMMAEDLKQIQEIDPSVKSLDDMPQSFFNLIATGKVSGVEAYYAVKAQQDHDAINKPTPAGQVNESNDGNGFFTRDEVAAMSQEEVSKNYEAIRKSMAKW